MKIAFNEYPEILTRVKASGFVVFESNDYDLNIIGERNPSGKVNKFDDWIHVCFTVDGIWQWYAYKCTTDAGLHYLKKGNTAILVHDQQYRGAYIIGLHRGQYFALVQRGNAVDVWRDRNKDDQHDYGSNMERGFFGINIHRASAKRETKIVDEYSAGCQVFADPDDFDEFMTLCRLQVDKLGYDQFSYTLLMGL